MPVWHCAPNEILCPLFGNVKVGNPNQKFNLAQRSPTTQSQLRIYWTLMTVMGSTHTGLETCTTHQPDSNNGAS